eukprot:6797264-Pyramimonas_sp.AAC.1
MSEEAESYAHCNTRGPTDAPGKRRGSFRWLKNKRIDGVHFALPNLKWSAPLLSQSPRRPTRN